MNSVMMLSSINQKSSAWVASIVVISLLSAMGFGSAKSQNVDKPGGIWASAMYCAFNVQSRKKLGHFLESRNVEKIPAIQVDDQLKLLEKTDFSRFFRVKRNSVKAVRAKDAIYENGKVTDKFTEFFIVWGIADVSSDDNIADAQFCLVVGDQDRLLDLKGLPPRNFSRYLTIVTSGQSNVFGHAVPSFPRSWMLAVHSAEFKNHLQGVNP